MFKDRYEWRVGLRYLRAKRAQHFISVITFISMGGVALGVAALIVVLAVMTGFREVLQGQILGITGHVTIRSYSGDMPNVADVLDRVDPVPGVLGAAPFILGQAMLKSRERALGITLRGVDIKREKQVSDLEKNLVHGDLKPGNVILTLDGEPKILDFGVARFRGEEVLPEPTSGDPEDSNIPQRADYVHGTPWYMAPERFYGQPSTAAADVFAFGAMLYQMITGDLPFPGESLEAIREAVLDVDHARLPSRVPERFVRPIAASLARDPERRGGMESIAAMLTARAA